MAVLESSTASVTPATGSSFTITITVPATTPVLIVHVALSSTTATVSSVAWSLGGSATQITSTRNSDAFISIWALPAPASGSGTITVTLSASVPFQSFATTFTGADQTTPCPVADAVTGVSNVIGSHTVTPTNLTANDATSAAGANTVAGNPLSVTPNQRYVNSTTAVNELGGDATGTTGVTLNWDSGGGFGAFAAVRIVAAAGGTTLTLGQKAWNWGNQAPAVTSNIALTVKAWNWNGRAPAVAFFLPQSLKAWAWAKQAPTLVSNIALAQKAWVWVNRGIVSNSIANTFQNFFRKFMSNQDPKQDVW